MFFFRSRSSTILSIIFWSRFRALSFSYAFTNTACFCALCPRLPWCPHSRYYQNKLENLLRHCLQENVFNNDLRLNKLHNLPFKGHSWTLHISISTLQPTQSRPSLIASCNTVLERCFSPAPHVAVHPVHSPKGLHLQFIGGAKIQKLYRIICKLFLK